MLCLGIRVRTSRDTMPDDVCQGAWKASPLSSAPLAAASDGIVGHVFVVPVKKGQMTAANRGRLRSYQWRRTVVTAAVRGGKQWECVVNVFDCSAFRDAETRHSQARLKRVLPSFG